MSDAKSENEEATTKKETVKTTTNDNSLLLSLFRQPIPTEPIVIDLASASARISSSVPSIKQLDPSIKAENVRSWLQNVEPIPVEHADEEDAIFKENDDTTNKDTSSSSSKEDPID